MSNNTGTPLLGCASHCFQVAVKDIIAADDFSVLQVQKLKKKLRTSLISVKLRRLKPLRPKVRNETRWSSTFEMSVRRKQFYKHVMRLIDGVINSLILNPAVERRVDNPVMQIGNPYEVTKKASTCRCYLLDCTRVLRRCFRVVPKFKRPCGLGCTHLAQCSYWVRSLKDTRRAEGFIERFAKTESAGITKVFRGVEEEKGIRFYNHREGIQVVLQ